MYSDNNAVRSVAYGCIYTRRIKRNDDELKTTKVYQELCQAVSKASIGSEPIECRVDILTAMYRKRKHFDQIISDFCRDFQPRSPEHARAVVMITDLLSLGTTPEEFSENFLRLYEAQIGLQVLHCPEAVNNLYHFTTVDENLLFKQPHEIQKLMEEIPTINFVSRCGRKKKEENQLSRAFILYYWLYESYYLKEPEVLDNPHFKTTKWSFHTLCDLFEQSDIYPMWENYWTSFPDMFLGSKPKRHGVLPEKFPELVELVDNQNVPLKEACYKLRIPKMTPMTYQRLKLKEATGKSGMASASRKYYDSKHAERCLDSCHPDAEPLEP